MDIFTTRPIEEIDYLHLKGILNNRSIGVSPHAFDHLSEKQRKVFKEEELFHMVEKEVPRKIYLQQNGRYAAYYRKSDGYRKLILEVEDPKTASSVARSDRRALLGKLTIVTFMDTIEIPKIRLQND